MAYVVGIDVGTSYTAAAIGRDDRADVFELGSHSAAVPTVLAFEPDGDVVVGEPAQWLSATDPSRVVREFKRRIGDPVPLLVDGSPHSADELMARTIGWVVEQATDREDSAPEAVVITHPANWGPYKLEQLGQVAYLADVADPVFLSEPEAAARHYASQERLDPGAIVAVYDLGGGTFDVALLRHLDGGGFELAGRPGGIERLGGADFDEAVFGHVRRAVGTETMNVDVDDPTAMRALARLRQECVTAKELLSTTATATIPVMLPNVQTEVRLTRAEFEAMIRPSLLTTITALDRTLRDSDLTADQIDAVLLVGGSSRIPLVAELISSELNRPVVVDTHPKFAVALGAARRSEATVGPTLVGAGGPTIAAAAAGAAAAAAASATTAAPPQVPAPTPGAPTTEEREPTGTATRAAGAGAVGTTAARGLRSGGDDPPRIVWPDEPDRPATGPPAPDRRKKRRWWPWVLLFLLLLGGLIGIGVVSAPDDDSGASTAVDEPDTTEAPLVLDVPVVVGMSEDDAAREIEGAGFTFAVQATEEVDDDQVGEVLSQTPESGTADEGATVSIVVGVARETVFVDVPDVEGLSPTDAADRLGEAGLGYSSGTPVDLEYGDERHGLVQSQEPSAGESVAEGTRVTVRIGEAAAVPDPVRVPNVVGMEVGDARDRLVGDGFTFDRGDDVEVPADGSLVGQVVDQTPGGGQSVDPGSTITVHVGVAEVEAAEAEPEVVAEEPTDDGADAAAPEEPAAVPNPCPSYDEFAADYPMRLCHKGPLVAEVQQALRNRGYDVEADGYYGPSTADAVASVFGDGNPTLSVQDVEFLVSGV